MKYIPNKLREYRKAKGLSQRDVADYLGFRSTDRISRWEGGLTYPHVANLLKLVKLFGVSAEILYESD
jgi:transcriptional regulator with XRE-family HTH domain